MGKAFEIEYKYKKVEIHIIDFVGDVRNINGTPDLFSLSYNSNTNDKGQYILATEAEINIYEDDFFNIDELKTVGETDILIKYFEHDELVWQGFALPDFFQTGITKPRVLRIVATDRLGVLKDIVNTSTATTPKAIIEECLLQTGLSLPVEIRNNNTYLETTTINRERIEGVSAYDVIRAFMVQFNSKIVQYKNKWWIVNKKLLEDGFLGQEIIDIDLVYLDGQREIKPTASEVSLYMEFGGAKRYPKNWNFDKWTSNVLNNWTSYNGFVQNKNSKVPIRYNSSYSLIYGQDTNINSLLSRNAFLSQLTDSNYINSPHIKSDEISMQFIEGVSELKFEIDFTSINDDRLALYMVLLIRIPNNNPAYDDYIAVGQDGRVVKAGTTNIDLTNVPVMRVQPAIDENQDRLTAIRTTAERNFKISAVEDLGLTRGANAKIQIVLFGTEYNDGTSTSLIDIVLHSTRISFNDFETKGKGLIFKTKQGGDKFSKVRETETTIFSDKINQGVNGYFYNYKYDDTSITNLPKEYLLGMTRQMADMFCSARDFYSLGGKFKVNPLARYRCGNKYFVLVGGVSHRENSEIDIEEIVSNSSLTRTDYIYTYFEDSKDNVKSIGTASGSGGVGGGSGGGGMTSSQLEMLTNLADWWRLDEENDAIYSEKSVYSLKGVSALGLGDDGGGGDGGGIDMLDSWANYTTAKANYYAPASLLVPFRDDTLSRLASLEAGGGAIDIEIVVTGSGNAVTGVSKSGNTLTFAKSSIFALSTHNHTIANVTGLQDALDGKSATSHTHTFASLTNKPTTISGYEITDAYTKAEVNSLASYVGAYDLPNGFLVKTDVARNENSMLVLHIKGNSYSGRVPINTFVQVYNYRANDAIVNTRALNNGYKINEVKVFYYNNLVYFWVPQQISYQTMTFQLLKREEQVNRVDSVTNAAVPTSGVEKMVTIIPQTAWFEDTLTNLSQLTDNIGVATHIANTSNPHNVTKAQVGLENVDNTSDANKPISTATQNALNTHFSNGTDNAKHLTDAQLAYLNDLIGWWKVDASGNLYTEKNLYSTKGVSALGLGSNGGGGSGGGVDMLDSWANYTEAKANYYVPSSLLVPFRNDTIAQITGLQDALDLKATQSDIDTAIGDIEIGGRNLILNSLNRIRFLPNVASSPIQNQAVSGENYRQFRRTYPEGVTETHIITHTNEYFTPEKSGYYTYSVYFRPNEFDIELRLRLTSSVYGDLTLCKANEWTQVSVTTYIEAGVEAQLFGAHGDMPPEAVQWIDYNRVSVTSGNKATDWTPAPEDQVSDWNVTDVNSFAFLKNKPTQLSQFTDDIGVASHIENKANPHEVTKSQVGLGDVDNTSDLLKPISNAVQTALNLKANLANPTFTGNVTAPTFVGALSGNASSATQLQTSRTIAGVSFDGTENINIPFDNLASKPTTLGGYGITDAYTKAEVNSISNTITTALNTHIANKANPHSVTTAQIGAVNLTTNQTIGGKKTFSSSVNMLGSLNIKGTGGYSEGIRIKGVSGISSIWFNVVNDSEYDAGMFGITHIKGTGLRFRGGSTSASDLMRILDNGNVGIGTTNPLYKLDVSGTSRFTGNVTASAGISTPKVIFAAAGWSLEQVGTELQMKHNGAIKQRMLSDGTILATAGITALSTE